jgi:membrane peptidoglycan carboxypeptidase
MTEKILGKDRILELYLERDRMGARESYGAEAASEAYYKIPAREGEPRSRRRAWPPVFPHH